MKFFERLSDWAKAARPWLLMILVAPIVIPLLVLTAPIIVVDLLLDQLSAGARLIAIALVLLGALFTAVYFIGWPVLTLLGVFVGMVIVLGAVEVFFSVLSDL